MGSIEHFDYQCGREVAARQMLHFQVEQMAEFVAQFPEVWLWGDGYGGELYYLLEEALTMAGFPPKTYEKSTKSHRRSISRTKFVAVMEKSDNCCVACGSKESLELDHIVPWSKGGGNELDNLQILCKPCNASKGAKSMDEWKGRKS
jgi:hypothetical protein